MAADRRKYLRTPFVEDCSWQRAARVTDLSVHGCYVDSHRVPRLGETVEFTVRIWEDDVPLRGTVVHAKSGVGFAIAFDVLEESTVNRIASFVLSTAPVRTTH
jgi:hypothetical protein